MPLKARSLTVQGSSCTGQDLPDKIHVPCWLVQHDIIVLEVLALRGAVKGPTQRYLPLKISTPLLVSSVLLQLHFH